MSLIRNVLRLQFGTRLGLDSSHVSEFGSRSESFAKTSFQGGGFKNQHKPNWEKYRIGKGRMWIVKAQSSHWRVTCDFPNFGVDCKDYARAPCKNLNPLKYDASGECREMEYINIGDITVQSAKQPGGRQKNSS